VSSILVDLIYSGSTVECRALSVLDGDDLGSKRFCQPVELSFHHPSLLGRNDHVAELGHQIHLVVDCEDFLGFGIV
jgi:hypothetical protein